MTKLSRSENRSKWYKLVESYQEYEFSKETFCIEHSIKKPTLDYWIRKYRFAQRPSNVQPPGFASIITKTQNSTELRINAFGIDVFIPMGSNPILIRSFLQAFSQTGC